MVEKVYWQCGENTANKTEKVEIINNKWIRIEIDLPTLTKNAYKDSIYFIESLVSLQWVTVRLLEDNVISVVDKVLEWKIPADG